MNFKAAADTIETIKNPISNFHELYVKNNRPVIIQNLIDTSKMKLWDLNYLQEKLADEKLAVTTSKDSTFHPKGSRPEKLSFTEFKNYILDPNDTRKLYLQQTSIPDKFPQLMQDVVIPNYLSGVKKKNLEINLWISKSGSISHLHFDLSNNFLIQIMGHKHLVLIEPKYTKFLYQSSVKAGWYHLSETSIDNADFNKYPKMQNVRIHEIQLNPGEVLYLPPGWWHEVKTLNPSISVNIWWPSTYRQWLIVPQHKDALKSFLYRLMKKT